MDKTRLFFIINTFSAGGGAEALLTSIINELYDTGRYDIGMMEIIHHDKKREEIRSGVRMYPYFTSADAPDRKTRMYLVYHEWDKVINDYIPNDYDIYISFNYLKPTFLLPKGKRCIAWIHGDVYNLINKYPGLRDMSEECELQRLAFDKADRIVAISDNTRQSIIDIFPEYSKRIVTIYNGINIKTIRKRSHEDTDIELQHPAIICVGRLEDGKDPIRALKIFYDLKQVKTDAHLYYLGDGSLIGRILEEAENRNLRDCVHLLGYLQNPFPVLKQADVTIMTSKSEGFPMSLLESVALNVPFVSTAVGGSKELAAHSECGKVFEKDEDAVTAICGYLNMFQEEIKTNTDKAIECFSMENYITHIESLIQEVMES